MSRPLIAVTLAAITACAVMAGVQPAQAQTGIQFDGTNDYVTFGQATATLGTPTLTLARGDHTTTLWTAAGEGFDTPEFDHGVVLVGVFDERSTSAAVGAVRVEVTRYRCREP